MWVHALVYRLVIRLLHCLVACSVSCLVRIARLVLLRRVCLRPHAWLNVQPHHPLFCPRHCKTPSKHLLKMANFRPMSSLRSDFNGDDCLVWLRHLICCVQVSGTKGNVRLTDDEVSVHADVTQAVDGSSITPYRTLSYACYSQAGFAMEGAFTLIAPPQQSITKAKEVVKKFSASNADALTWEVATPVLARRCCVGLSNMTFLDIATHASQISHNAHFLCTQEFYQYWLSSMVACPRHPTATCLTHTHAPPRHTPDNMHPALL